MMNIYMVCYTLIVTTCLMALVSCQTNDKVIDSNSEAGHEDIDSNTDYKEKIAVDPGGLPVDKSEDRSVDTGTGDNLPRPVDEPEKSPEDIKDRQNTENNNIMENEIQTETKSTDDVNTQHGDTNLQLTNDVVEVDKDPVQSDSLLHPTNEQQPNISDKIDAKESSTEVEMSKVTDSSQVKVTEQMPIAQEVPESERAKDKEPAVSEEVKPIEDIHTKPDSLATDETKSQLPQKPDGHTERSDLEVKEATEESTTKQDNVELKKSVDKEGEEKPTDKDDNELETFSEYWTKSVMEEEEKSKQIGDIPGTSGPVTKQPKRKHNFASKECGAKILANNPEAENVKGILNSNKDDYMINPCKARKWFIIELCEPVQLSTVDIASFELFSSQPKHFTVGFSDRYPTKEWKTYGFHTKDERVLQTFQLPEEDVYFKYVRVEITDHYGEEHFCPLTMFKVFGTAVEYDDDFNAPTEDDHDLDSAVLQTGEETGDHESPKNLFASAKDTVIKIVKKVLNVDEKDKSDEKNGTEILNATQLQSNDTEALNMSSNGFMLPCEPDARTPTGPSSEPKVIDGEIQPQPPYHATSTMSQDTVSPADGEMKPGAISSIVTKLEDHEQIPSEGNPDQLVTLIGSENDGDNLQRKISDCFYNNSVRSSGVKCHSRDLCAYVNMMMSDKAISMCDIQESMTTTGHGQSVGSKFIKMDKTVTSEISESSAEKLPSEKSESTMQTSTTVIKQDPLYSREVNTKSVIDSVPIVTVATDSPSSDVDVKQSEVDSPETKVDLSTSSVSMATQTVDVIATSSSAYVIETPSVTLEDSKPVETLASSNKPNVQDGITLEPSIISSSVVEVSPQQEQTPALDETSHTYKPNTEEISKIPKPSGTVETSITVRQSVKEKEKETQVDVESSFTDELCTVTDLQSTCSDGQKLEPQATETMLEPSQTEPGSTTEYQGKDIIEPIVQEKTTGSIPSNQELKTDKGTEVPKRDLGLVRVPLMPFQKRDPIMRLSNRIKALELNVSLSSRFLDRMSQKFKRQSDELMKTLNKTIGQFENVTKEAELREKKQQEQITILEAHVENLTNVVIRLTEKMDSIDKQVTDRQMVWTSIEVVILVTIFLICLRRRKSTPVYIPPEIQRLLDKMPHEPDLSLNPRRNSFCGVEDKSHVQTLSPGIQKYRSETALASSADTTDGTKKFDPGGNVICHATAQIENGKETTKKKKKKKKLHDKLLHPKGSNESLTDINSAGLLFSAGGKSSGNDECDTLQRSSSHSILTYLFGDKTSNSCSSNKSTNSKKVTIGPVFDASDKPPNLTMSGASGHVKHKRYSLDESGSKVKKTSGVPYSQSYCGIQEVQKGKTSLNGNCKCISANGQVSCQKGPLLNGKVRHGKNKHVRGGSADFTKNDKSSGIWMNMTNS